MKKITLFVFTWAITLASFGQNWHVLPSANDTISMIDSNKRVWSAFADSIITNPNGRITYLNKRISTPPIDTVAIVMGCRFFGAGATHIGKTIIETDSSILFCYWNDTVRLQRFDTIQGAYYNLQYVIYPDSLYYTQVFNGQFDSVKKYTVVVTSPQHLQATHHIRLSKNNGLLSFPHVFDEFFENNENTLKYPASQLKRKQKQLLTYGDVYDFNLGDEFHFETRDKVGSQEIRESLINWVIVDKISTTLTVHYKIWRKEEIKSYSYIVNQGFPNRITTTTFLADTFSTPTYQINEPIGSGITLKVNIDGKYGYYLDDTIRMKYEVYDVGQFFSSSQCMGQGISFNPSYYTYEEGLGQTIERITYNCGNSTNSCEKYDTWMIYAQKGGVTDGAPKYVSIEELEILPSVIIYPNPTQHTLYIGHAKTGQYWSLTDATGRTLMNGQFEETEAQIDVTRLTAGVYILATHGQYFKIVKQ